MEANHFRPGTVYPYLVEWNNDERKIQVRKMDENLTLGKLEGGDKDDDYKNYYLGMKYMIYCEDGNGNLVIHSFAVDYRSIHWGFSDAFTKFKEKNKDKLQDVVNWEDIKAHPGFTVPGDQEEGYERKISAIMSDQNAFDIKAEINFDEKLGKKIASCIIACFNEYKADDLTPKILAFSDVHGGVLSYAIGVKMMEKLKETHEDLITVCEGDAIGRKGDYYAGKRVRGVWNAGKFPDLASIYIIHHVHQLVNGINSRFVYLHGNHDYAIEYPTVMSYTTKNYQLIFSHGMIEPQLLDELKKIPRTVNGYNENIDSHLDDKLVYSWRLLEFRQEVKLFAFGKKSIARETKNNLFRNENDNKEHPKITSIFSSDIKRPTEGWDEKVEKLTALQTRDYLTNYFFIPANIKKFGKGEVIPKRTIDQMNEALLALYEFAVGAQDGVIFNPIFTFGHDYNYEVWSYYAQLKNEGDGDLSKFPLNSDLWNKDYEWETEKEARLKDHLMARVFCVDGNHYLDEKDYKENGPYTKINKYDGEMNVYKRETTDDDTSVGISSSEEEEEEEEVKDDGFIERMLQQGDKDVSFTRGLLIVYYDEDGTFKGEVSGIYDKCCADDAYIDSTTFKLLVILKGDASGNTAFTIIELFFMIAVEINDGNRTAVVEKIAETLTSSFDNYQPLFFIFSPSIHTLECYQGVLECIEHFPDAYFIATSSPLSGDAENKAVYWEKVLGIQEKYIKDDAKYIELFDYHQVDSCDRKGILNKPVAVMLNLPIVNVLLSNSIYYLNFEVLKESKKTTTDAEIVTYHYDLNKITDAVNKDFSDAPEIPMTEGSLVNLMKSIFDEKNEYDLTFRPETLDHIAILQSSLNDEKKEMKIYAPTVISTAEVKWNNDNSAIDNLYVSLYNVLIPSGELEDNLKPFFDANSNPLILTSDNDNKGVIFDACDKEQLKDAIEYHDHRKNNMLSRLYSLYSDRQLIVMESSHDTESEQVENAPVRNVPTNEGAMGGVVTSKKKAIIISIILGAILIIVIVVVVIVTSRNEGFKPRMGKIKP